MPADPTPPRRYAFASLFGPGRDGMVSHTPHAAHLGIRVVETGPGFGVCALPLLTAIATIDLRVDYLRAAEPDLELYARSDCYRLTRNVAFVRAVAWDRTADDPFASALGTFMLGANRSDSSFERLVRGKKHDFELDPDDVRTIDELVA